MIQNIYGYGIIITFLTLILIDVFLLVLTVIRTRKEHIESNSEFGATEILKIFWESKWSLFSRLSDESLDGVAILGSFMVYALLSLIWPIFEIILLMYLLFKLLKIIFIKLFSYTPTPSIFGNEEKEDIDGKGAYR
jgi:hypothetical protein